MLFSSFPTHPHPSSLLFLLAFSHYYSVFLFLNAMMGDAPFLSHSFAYSFGCVGIAFKFFICTLQFRSAGLALEGQREIGNENFVRSVAKLRLAFHNFLATNEVFRYVSF
jgi:hypothetical protein